MGNPLNPLDWLESAQNWFTKTERSSGFRAYLIFLLIVIGFSVIVMWLFPGTEVAKTVVPVLLYISVGAFVVLFGAKAFLDPNFCRSEKHVQSVRKLELMQQKGDNLPQPIDISTTPVISNPAHAQIEDSSSKIAKSSVEDVQIPGTTTE